jgi:hypothetical protein
VTTQQRAPDLAREYLAWLKDRFLTVDRGQSQVLSTPFLDPFHDGIEICLDHQGSELVLHDAGKTLEHLLDMGVSIDKSERRQSIVEHAIAGCGVRFEGGRLITVATPDSLAQRAHFLLTAVSRLNDLWMSATPRTSSDFFAVVKEFLDERDAHYVANVPIPGRTVDHPMDFVISLGKGRERLLKLMASPSLQAAKLASFAWMELKDTRPQAERLVLVNDMQLPDALEDGQEAVAHMHSKSISEQAVAILQTYSTGVMRWSARNDASFLQRLMA